ncbi:MAG: hypothetical protein JSU63_07860 [Phycisphaerales bacterium]|nr:MAG: hypothetical protein JSU63_07860 [Phycisphaerales bacterium]
MVVDGGTVTKEGDMRRSPDVGFRLCRLEHRGLVLTDNEPPDEDLNRQDNKPKKKSEG